QKSFQPDGELEKEAAAEILVKALGWAEEAKALKAEEVTAALIGLTDQGAISDYRRPYVALAVKKGLLPAQGQLQPGRTLTRGETALLLNQANQLLDRSTAYKNLKNYALGPNTCQTCHGEQHQNWSGTMHSRMVQPVSKPGATFANFATNKVFKAEDAALVVGGLTNQRFLSKEFKYLNAYWDMKSRQWVDYKGGTSWLAACARCHSTGYDKSNLTFVDFGISCESCHGPGAQHVAGGGDKAKISVAVSDQVCSSCHGGQAKELESMGHATFFAEQLEKNPGYKDFCITCHSATAFLAKAKGQPVPKLTDFKTGALKDDRMGITCVVCHDPHNLKEEAQLRKNPLDTCVQCHTANLAAGAKLAAGKDVHHPQKEMFLGVGGYGAPDTPHAKVVTCADCHMKGLDTEGVTHVNHEFKPMVDETLQTKHGPVTVNACQQCHTRMSKDDLKAYQATVEKSLGTVKALLDNLKAQIDVVRSNPAKADLVKKYDEAYTNWSFVTNDKSKGIHNYKYANDLLQAAKQTLEIIAATP
ncbi:MAG: ammonia-forming cytochrome c nitrite reductase subunit c552, partial [Firmicutes bacterium]|nr:ammonia-forming cytochrome c nitrite reductase subunit c552 [Bacillota bacterium]